MIDGLERRLGIGYLDEKDTDLRTVGRKAPYVTRWAIGTLTDCGSASLRFGECTDDGSVVHGDLVNVICSINSRTSSAKGASSGCSTPRHRRVLGGGVRD